MDSSRQHLDHAIERIRNVGLLLAADAFDPMVPYASLVPLGFALLHVAALFEVLVDGHGSRIAQLFSGDEDESPNIDTRLRSVRDLCSASSYAARYRSQKALNASAPGYDSHPSGAPGDQFWYQIIRRFVDWPAEDDLIEVCRFLDEMFEAALEIAEMLRSGGSTEQQVWDEVYRHVTHVRDHYDCVEEAIIDCIRPAD